MVNLTLAFRSFANARNKKERKFDKASSPPPPKISNQKTPLPRFLWANALSQLAVV